MAGKNKWGIDFYEVEKYMRKIEQFGSMNDVQKAVEKGLEKSQSLVAEKTKSAMSKHKRTGQTAKAIIDGKKTEWDKTGTLADVSVGFQLHGKNKGQASQFLMFGTTLYGEPHVRPDKELYEAVYGQSVREKARKLQLKEFEKVLAKLEG